MQAQTVLMLVEIWLWIGAAVAAVFLLWGIDRVDEDARGAYVFRPLLVPGVLLIWPLVLWRWWALETGRDRWQRRHAPPRGVQGIIALGMALAIVAILLAGALNRQVWPADAPAVRLSEAGQ